MNHFTPFSALAGGALIGLSAAALFLLNGRVAGISGIVGGLLRPARGETLWRAVFVAGVLAGGLLLQALYPAAFHDALHRSTGALVVAGLLVGYGSRLGNGCTSGHGVCGISRLSVRSLAATATFMATGVATAAFVRHVLGGSV